MFTPQLTDELVAQLYLESKRKSRPMAKILNDILKHYFTNDLSAKQCSKCGQSVEAEYDQKTGYCEHCESEVFVV